ncbi:MAG: phospho-sugar mutase [Cryomorphaceae bacterium]|nr:MAG: phospho-sugar mutase [Cryomorphaceae bacterium]
MGQPTEERVLQRAQSWTQAPYDEQTRQQVQQMMADQSDELTEAFYRDLEFGTGGLRGIMGPGTNRVNRYTIAMATQGLCNYIRQCGIENPKAAIAFDCRYNSAEFARTAAEVFAANGVQAYLFESLRPTPELSFAVRQLGCTTGIVVTASHNPPEYNGYKVYWNDGGQIVAPHDTNIIAEVRKMEGIEQVRTDVDESLIQVLGKEMDRMYLQAIRNLYLLNDAQAASELKVVFTPLHGTSVMLVPDALREAGFTHTALVKEQSHPDPAFSTVKSPNPEEREALAMALAQGEQSGADIILGTDPDADRVGIAVRNLKGELELLNGNQAASVLIYYLLEKWKELGKLQGNEFVCKTVVTSDLLGEIARDYGVNTYETLTGFKYIADVIARKEGSEVFIGGGEESYGYLVGDLVRDKDAVISSVMLCEAAAWAKSRGSSFYALLLDIYARYGCYRESLVSVTRKGRDGAEEIKMLMETLRTQPPQQLGGVPVMLRKDFQSQEVLNLENGQREPIGLPKSNVLQFVLQDGSKITARPSGTEPKIKFYFSLKAPLSSTANFHNVWTDLGRRTEQMVSELPIPG